MIKRKAWTPEEAAEQVGCCRATVFAEIKAKRLLARKLGRRTLILDEDLTNYLRALPVREVSADEAA
jgi:excisionase family DNA binding protein